MAWLLVTAVRHHLQDPEAAKTESIQHGFGAITLRVKLPGTAGGIPEPLIVSGRPGSASLVFIRLLHRNRAQLGVEFWGKGFYESSPFELPASDAEVEITCYLPAFFPKEGDPYWGTLSPALQKIRQTEYLLTLDHVVQLKGNVDYVEAPNSEIYFGADPIGGSYVSSRFTGSILKISRPR